MAASASERLAAARTAVERASQLLLSPTPEQMDGSARQLETAISEITEFRNCGTLTEPGSVALRQEAMGQARLLKRSIFRAARLLESAALYHAHWLRCLGALSAGYTPRGQPAAVEHHVRLLARG